jgi:hypothetical protein
MNDTFDVLAWPDLWLNRAFKVRWFAKSDRGNVGGIARTPEMLVNAARLSEHSGYNMYVTLNPTNERICKRICAADVTHWAFVLVDLDPPLNAVHTANDTEPVMRRLLDLGLRPAIIETGRGVQYWLRFKPQLIMTPEERRYWPDVNRGFLTHLRAYVPEGWRIDLTADLARIARMPGSLNQRTGGRAGLLDPGRVENDAAVDVLRSFYVASPTPPHQSGDSEGREWTEVMDDLTLRAKTYINFGATEGSRHESCHHLCRTLREHGVSQESALEAMRLANEACYETLHERELLTILKQVYDA